MPHSYSRTSCSDLHFFWIGFEPLCGCWSGRRQRKKRWGGRKGTEMALSFFLFYLLVFLLFVLWHIHKSRVGYSLICSFIYQMFTVLGSGAKTMCKWWCKKKAPGLYSEDFGSSWHLNLVLWKLASCWTFIKYLLIVYYLPNPVLIAGGILMNNIELISVFGKILVQGAILSLWT